MQPSESWQKRARRIARHMNEEPLEDFMRWSTIHGTMVTGDVGWIELEYAQISDKWKSLLYESGRGNFVPSKLQPNTSAAMIHQAYHAWMFETKTGLRIADMSSIAEIGAGYGAFCLLAYRSGFRGQYYIVDIPELQPIQDYYLAKIHGVSWVDSGECPDCDLLVALNSLSEIPISSRVIPQHKHRLIAYAPMWDMENNEAWLDEMGLTEQYDGVSISRYRIA